MAEAYRAIGKLADKPRRMVKSQTYEGMQRRWLHHPQMGPRGVWSMKTEELSHMGYCLGKVGSRRPPLLHGTVLYMNLGSANH